MKHTVVIYFLQESNVRIIYFGFLSTVALSSTKYPKTIYSVILCKFGREMTDNSIQCRDERAVCSLCCLKTDAVYRKKSIKKEIFVQCNDFSNVLVNYKNYDMCNIVHACILILKRNSYGNKYCRWTNICTLLIFLLPGLQCLQFNVRLVVVERMSQALSQKNLTSALQHVLDDFRHYNISQHVEFNFSFSSFPDQRSALEQAGSHLFMTQDEHVVVCLGPFDLQTMLSKMARLYERPHISANVHTPHMALNDYTMSLLPDFYQVSQVVEKVLFDLQWQEVVFVVSLEDVFWITLATELQVNLARGGFLVKDEVTLSFDDSVEDARKALGQILPTSKGESLY